jgi:hypothetical protein
LIGLGEAAGERQDDAATGGLGDASGPFANLSLEHVRLLRSAVWRL